MKYLRIFLVIYAIAALISSFIFFTRGGLSFLFGIYLLIVFAVLIFGTFFEKKYNPKSSAKSGWQKTGEKFQDPKSDKLVEVHFNPKTGERKYVDSN